MSALVPRDVLDNVLINHGLREVNEPNRRVELVLEVDACKPRGECCPALLPFGIWHLTRRVGVRPLQPPAQVCSRHRKGLEVEPPKGWSQDLITRLSEDDVEHLCLERRCRVCCSGLGSASKRKVRERCPSLLLQGVELSAKANRLDAFFEERRGVDRHQKER